MKERPILFSAPMVRAILDGTKTQTRRIVPNKILDAYYSYDEYCNNVMPRDVPCTRSYERDYFRDMCKYGLVGDRLWVRESFYYDYNEKLSTIKPDNFDVNGLYYRADGSCCEQIAECACAEVGPPRWTPSIHMPRWVSRINLEITNIRVERLNDVSQEDARSEGITDGGCINCGVKEPCNCQFPMPDARDSFIQLWESINGELSWFKNPWVWVVEFKRVYK